MQSTVYSEKSALQRKFDTIRGDGVLGIPLKAFASAETISWAETEWEFPKGRKLTPTENNVDCAIREFGEESGIIGNFRIVDTEKLFCELFIGSNLKTYRNVFFIAKSDLVIELFAPQETEVSMLAWKTFDECQQAIRPYHIEKKRMLSKIHSFCLKL